MIFMVDVDGTLTTTPNDPWGRLRTDVLGVVRSWIARGDTVVLWSARGKVYCEEFARLHGLTPTLCIGKPDVIVDDKPSLRDNGQLEILAPERVVEWNRNKEKRS